MKLLVVQFLKVIGRTENSMCLAFTRYQPKSGRKVVVVSANIEIVTSFDLCVGDDRNLQILCVMKWCESPPETRGWISIPLPRRASCLRNIISGRVVVILHALARAGESSFFLTFW